MLFLLLCLASILVGQNWLMGQDPILVGAGDIAMCGRILKRAEATAEVLDQVVRVGERSGSPVVVFTLGDLVYSSGTAENFRRCYGPTWGRHKKRTRPSIGNHEYSAGNGLPYFDYFGKVAGTRGKGYYSYDLGSWHIVVLNSNCQEVGGCQPGSPQYEWLRDDLKTNAQLCSLAYFHHPLFSSGRHGPVRRLEPVYQLLYESGLELVLSGHDHHYERFLPQDPSGALDERAGIRQFVVGTGGRGPRWTERMWRLFRGNETRPGSNSEVTNSDTYGVLKLVLRTGSYDWEFLPVEGGVFRDAGSDVCHLAP